VPEETAASELHAPGISPANGLRDEERQHEEIPFLWRKETANGSRQSHVELTQQGDHQGKGPSWILPLVVARTAEEDLANCKDSVDPVCAELRAHRGINLCRRR